MATQIPPSRRTQGDGMEKVENEVPTEQTIVLRPQILKEVVVQSEKPITSRNVKKNLGLAIKLTPHAIDKRKKDILSNLKNKEPKFVPYEPYKAAVRPIIPPARNAAFREVVKKKSKDLTPIVNAHKNVPVPEVKENNEQVDEKKEEADAKETEQVDWEAKTKALELELRTLREENEQLENQLKFQVQVNGELKNLLVAAVGEDMETKVHVLTEDKLHLAQALLKSAESLTTHQEQTEWLAGQCEVWRSKFLASSVMVEELARWKASLSQKVNEAHDVLRKLLDEGKQVRECVTRTHANLCRLRNKFDLRGRKPAHPGPGHVVEMSAENLKMSEVLLLELLGSERAPPAPPSGSDPHKKTPAEKSADHVLSNPNVVQLIGEPDAACSAVVGAAVTLSGQLYLQSHPPKIGCCPQCTGDLKLV